MIETLATRLIEQAQAFSTLEVVAVVFAIAYLLLAIRQNIWCWLCAGISTAIYIWLFIGARLYMESVLNGFYFVMAIYGWIVWTSGRSDGHERPVTLWPWKRHATAITAIVIVSLFNGYLLGQHTDAVFSVYRLADDVVRYLGDVSGRPEGAGELVVLACDR